MTDEDAGKIIKNIFWYKHKLEWISQIYFSMISVDLENLENSAMNGWKWGRPRKTIRKDMEEIMEALLVWVDSNISNRVRTRVKQRVKEWKDLSEQVIKNIIESVL